MLKQLEKLFGFRTTENTNIGHYLNRMDTMGKLDNKKINELTAVFIEKFIEIDEKLKKIETMNQVLIDDIDLLKKDGNEPSEFVLPKEIEQRLASLEAKEAKRANVAKARASKTK